MLEQAPVLMGRPVSLTVAALAELPYSPAVLLESSFDASITDHRDFRFACRCGFYDYFEAMYEWGETEAETVFVEKVCTWVEMVERVVRIALDQDEVAFRWSPSYRAGLGLGWLSALALVNRDEAVRGLTLLMVLLAPSL